MKHNAVDKLFNPFREELQKKNLLANEGKIIDASFVEVPIQRNGREENKQIKEGKTPEDWKEKPNKREQKDTECFATYNWFHCIQDKHRRSVPCAQQIN